jgi:Glycosyl hydrolases family 35
MRGAILACLMLVAQRGLCPAPVTHPPATGPAPEFVEAVEFPYYLYPRAQWERELVWMKTLGIKMVEFSIPWNWHQLGPGDFDFTGRTSPRRDLSALIHLLRKLDLRAWVRPLPPVAGWLNNGWPPGPRDSAAEAAWMKQLEGLLATQTSKHGGPVAFVEGHELAIDAAPPPMPVTVVSVTDSSALARSRSALASARGALLWTNLEESLYPAGWQGTAGALLHPGAVDLSGNERPAAAALRRNAALLGKWGPLLAQLKPVSMPAPAAGKLPRGVTAAELVSPSLSAVSLINRGAIPFHDDLRVLDPVSKRVMVIPGVSVAAGDSLWLPLNVTLGGNGLCRECTAFSGAERIVYATAELFNVEFENGILAMEFAAPEASEVILQLEREPVGPFIAAAKPTKFDWDEKTLRARLPIPASKTPGNRVRVGLAIEPPETSAFFSDAKRLLIGQKNQISTVYSSPEVAARSRLRVPDGFTATASQKSPNEIDYTVEVPADASHGDWASLVLEADGVPLGRARLQLLRPVSIRVAQALQIHFGQQSVLQADPSTVPVDARAGSNVEVILRNNSLQIQNYRLEASGDNLDFSPPRTEVAVAALAERTVSLRVFPKEGAAGLFDWRLHVGGSATMDLPLRAIVLPRDGTEVWTADLDGDGSPEWVVESQKVRAVFSSKDGGRWTEFIWKDTGTNFLPVQGALANAGAVQVRAEDGVLTFIGNGWSRSVSLTADSLTIEQTPALPAESLTAQTPGNLSFTIERPSAARAVYRVRQSAP